MSVPATEAGAPARETVELPAHGDLAFASLMDALAPEGGESTPEAGGQTAPAAADGAGQPAPADQGTGPQAAPAGLQPPGTPAVPDVPGGPVDAAGTAATLGDRGDLPTGWTAVASEVIPKLGELSTRIEEATSETFQRASLEEVREEYKNYFEALEKHPRLMVGQEVPAVGRDGMETLRDTNDAREWQEAVKHILVAEVRDRAQRQMEEAGDYLQTLHSSVELFTNNTDLVPGTSSFDRDLADRFAALAEPYELRVDGKLHGYSIPVQPIINQLRAQVAAERAARTTTATAPVPHQVPPVSRETTASSAAASSVPEPPQAGISSKAGAGSASEDFSTLFGTIGLPHLQI